jgi:hypothetical protein
VANLISELLTRVGDVCIGSELEASQVLADFAESVSNRELCDGLQQWLSIPSSGDELQRSARETSTHYVWPLRVYQKGYGLFLNEFKPGAQVTPGHATTVHNHRYSFATLVLTGGYRQIRHSVDITDGARTAQITELGFEHAKEGQVLAVNDQDFHRLAEIQDGTITLLLKCAPVKEFSTSVDMASHRVRTHLPVEVRLPLLIDVLSRPHHPTMIGADLDV